MGVKKSLQSLKMEERGKKCPECGSTDIEYQGSELICKKCGLVIED